MLQGMDGGNSNLSPAAYKGYMELSSLQWLTYGHIWKQAIDTDLKKGRITKAQAELIYKQRDITIAGLRDSKGNVPKDISKPILQPFEIPKHDFGIIADLGDKAWGSAGDAVGEIADSIKGPLSVGVIAVVAILILFIRR